MSSDEVTIKLSPQYASMFEKGAPIKGTYWLGYDGYYYKVILVSQDINNKSLLITYINLNDQRLGVFPQTISYEKWNEKVEIDVKEYSFSTTKKVKRFTQVIPKFG